MIILEFWRKIDYFNMNMRKARLNGSFEERAFAQNQLLQYEYAQNLLNGSFEERVFAQNHILPV